jgi:hypothetical protein
VTLDGNNPSTQIKISADRSALEALGEGAYKCMQQIRLTPKTPGSNVNVPGAVAQPDGSYLLPLNYTAEVNKPFDPNPFYKGGGAAAAAFAFFALLYSTTPRLPNKARFVPALGRNVDDMLLRAEERRTSRGRFLGRSISAGNSGDDVDLRVKSEAAYLHGKWLIPKKTVLEAAREGIRINGQPLKAGDSSVLKEGANVLIDGKRFTYTKK